MLNRSMLAALAFLAFVSPACAADAGDEGEPARTMTITGAGMVNAEPDLASLSAGVRTQGKTAREALTANTRSMSQVMKGMEGLGIAKKDIQTSNFSVSPLYEHYKPRPEDGGVRPPPKIVGYEVQNQVTIHVRDLARLGEALDTFVTLGANELFGVQFGFDDPAPLQEEARKRAVKDALDTAKLLTDAAGVGLGQILSISEMGYSSPQPKMAMSRMDVAESAVPIAAGEHTLTANVAITFELD